MSSLELEERKMEEGRAGQEAGVAGRTEKKEVYYYPRRNGWNCPWHPLQILAWAFIIFFTATYFGFLIFYIPGAWRSIGYILGGALFLTHIVASLVTSIMDPADDSVRRRRRRAGRGFLRSVFDRKKHKHVIEDRYCNICKVSVTTAAKHCRVCDKCVTGFDHHCIWLNTCIGSRNYRWFMVTVFSALVACILLLMFTLSLFISFFTARDKLRFNCADHFFLSTNSSSSSSSCSETIRLFGAAVPDPVFPVTVAVIGVLALLGVGMISYLALFHVYLNVRGLTTYDYILLQRRLEEERKKKQEEEEKAGEGKLASDGRTGLLGGCCPLRRNVNRIIPINEEEEEEEEEGQRALSGSPEGGVVSRSPSADLFNFGRTPVQSVMGSSVGDVSLDSATPQRMAATNWTQHDKSRFEEVVVVMESLPPQKQDLECSPKPQTGADQTQTHSNSLLEEEKRGGGRKCREDEEEEDVEGCGILAFISSANSISNEAGDDRNSTFTEKPNETAENDEYELENCGVLAFMSSSNSIPTLPTLGVQVTGDEKSEATDVVCGNNSPLVTIETAPPCNTLRCHGEATTKTGETASNGVKLSTTISDKNDEVREKGYEMLMESGNTVGLRALKHLSYFTRQSSPMKNEATEEEEEEDNQLAFHGYSNPMWESSQPRLPNKLPPLSRTFYPPPVRTSVAAGGQESNEDLFSSLATLV